MSILQDSHETGKRILENRSLEERKQTGQFLTPPVIARYMAEQLGGLPENTYLLDPAAGSGVLACAVIERAIEDRWPKRIRIDAFEIDDQLGEAAEKSLGQAATLAKTHGIQVEARVFRQDFLLAFMDRAGLSLFSVSHDQRLAEYTAIISNPPYFKLRRDDSRVKGLTNLLSGHTNIYTLFMGASIELLSDEGQMCFIVPRSFCSGAYFARFRQDLLHKSVPLHIHLFESRDKAFDSVLQENLIIALRKRQGEEDSPDTLTISTSMGIDGLENDRMSREVAFSNFAGSVGRYPYFRLPTSELDECILETVDSWPSSLEKEGLQISTGPVVAFRSRSFLRTEEAVQVGEAVPLYWLQNVNTHKLEWPADNGKKPQAISSGDGTESLLLPAANYVLLRRFSAKEEPRRLIAAPFLQSTYPYDQVGLENHLNYIYRERGGQLTPTETLGLSALLNSALIDRYFRIASGNTQVNATELRALPLPSLEVVAKIGDQVPDTASTADILQMNRVVYDTLRTEGVLPETLPLITETRMNMTKIQEAQEVLQALGLPEKQQNEISALTLLVLAQLSEDTPWEEAQSESLGIHDILVEMKERYDKEYAENTRETVRRQVIHQFIQAGIVVKNPDDPTLPTNSPRTHYALASPVVDVIQKYGTEDWAEAVQRFLEEQVALIERYQREREIHRIPLRLPTGEQYTLSPGVHNELQAQIVNEFGPVFAPGSSVLYIGDTENKTLHLESALLESLGLPITEHDKLPDVVLYDSERNWLYLIEAVTSHGPVSHKRFLELETLLVNCNAERIYVSAFPNFREFGRHIRQIAWDTEVWLADNPEHLIHFNGDKFFSAHS